MTDWKDDKDLGAWSFEEQQNKWGYLNNPKWQTTPQTPVDYTGDESDEPQVWPMNVPKLQNKYDNNDSTRHLTCGHWHKKYAPEHKNIYFLIQSGFGNRIISINGSDFSYSVGGPITAFTPTTDRAIIDPNNQFYYIGAGTDLYRIDLPLGTIHDSISVATYTNRNIVTIVVDRYNRTLYALTSSNGENPCYIFKIDLSTFSIIDYGTITEPPLLYPIKTAIIDDVNGNYIYAAGIGYFYRIDLSTLAYHSRISGLLDPACSVIDIAGGYGYFGGGEYNRVARLNLASFSYDELAIPTGYGSEIAIGIDLENRLLYYVPPPEVVDGLTTTTLYQISIADFSIIKSEVLGISGYTDALVIDVEDQKAYAGFTGSSSSIRRFNLSLYAQAETIYCGTVTRLGVIEDQNTV